MFEKTFGAEVTVTEELCVKHASDFRFNWALDNLLKAPARAEYRRVVAPARAEYERVVAPARAEYYRAIAPARVKFYRAQAIEFCRLYNEKELV
jgi:hypothetical protein